MMGSENDVSKATVVGVLLANAPNRKHNGCDKWLRKIAGRTLLDLTIARASPQVSTLIINANGDPTRFPGTNLPIVPDAIDDNSTTLTGILTGMEWSIEQRPEATWLATFSACGAFIPMDLVARMLSEIERHSADMAYIRSGGKVHQEFGIWPIELAEDLLNAISEEGVKRLDKWSRLYNAIAVEYSADPFDRFSYNNNLDSLLHFQAEMADGAV